MQNRVKIHIRIRHDINGTAQRPRVAVYRSLMNVTAQAIDDSNGVTVAGVSSQKVSGSLTTKAEIVAKELAAKLKELKINEVVFDRGGFRYHGAVKVVAETLREEGITV